MQCTRPFNIIIKPIGSVCNLDCAYCYYLKKSQLVMDPGESSQVMTDQMLEHLTRSYIEAQPEGTSEIVFSWQGGEPTLLGIPFYEKAFALQRRYARAGMKILNALQTNATVVTAEMARFFKEHEVLVGVSIDGPEHIHNHYRRYPDGSGSFSAMMKGYEQLKAAGVEVNTLTVIQDHNGDHPEEVYDFLCSIDSEYMQFIPVVEHDGQRILERSVAPLQFGSFLCSIFDRWVSRDIGRRFIQQVDMLLGIHMGQGSSLCVHAPQCGRALALEHNGKLYSCDHFVDQAHELGNIAQQEFFEMVDSPRQSAFGEAKSGNLPGECLSCPYLERCYGGCMRNRVRTARDGRPLNHLCEGYKMFYGHTEPYITAMGAALQHRRSAREYIDYFDFSRTGRNDRCPCGSGRKYKNCHGSSR
ncbi:MAG: anaerobic sulfatase maturase [Spirochaetia bacterium]|nr:anaerobic sulfatase maturase [Spirochaetia bacterium]MCF7940735.1 anaerobic sulfatase maturase [Spirochaetia bacterium]